MPQKNTLPDLISSKKTLLIAGAAVIAVSLLILIVALVRRPDQIPDSQPEVLPAVSDQTPAESVEPIEPAKTDWAQAVSTQLQRQAQLQLTAAQSGEKNIASGKVNAQNWKATVNSDVIGWLRIPGTNVDHAVVVGANNNSYTSLGYDKQYSYNGVIWAATGTKTGTRDTISNNTVLFGHNWTNYSGNPRQNNPNDIMFAQIAAYHHLDYALEHPYIYYSTLDEDMVFQVFACGYFHEDFNYITPDPGYQQQAAVLAQAQQATRHDFDGITVSPEDKILTLSTCTRALGQTSVYRFVVMAKLLPANAELTPVTGTALK